MYSVYHIGLTVMLMNTPIGIHGGSVAQCVYGEITQPTGRYALELLRY